MNTKQVSKEEILEVLKSTAANQMTISKIAEANLNKKDNPFYQKEGRSFVALKKVEKRSIGTYAYGVDYEAAVNEALVAEGKSAEFKTESLPWGEWETPNKLIAHNGKHYVRLYQQDDTKTEVEYLVDGAAATAEDMETIRTFEQKKSSGSAKQTEAGLEQTKQVKPNNICLDNIEWVEIEGTRYEITK